MGHHLQMRIASPFPTRDVCKRCPEPWTLLLLCSVQGKNQWKKHHDTEPESITPPLICHLCEAFLTPSSDLWPSQDCREVGPQAVEGLVNVQREVGPWHAETSPGDNSSMGKKLGSHAHLHLQHTISFAFPSREPRAPWDEYRECVRARPCSQDVLPHLGTFRALNALFLSSLGCEITPVICRASQPKLSRRSCGAAS